MSQQSSANPSAKSSSSNNSHGWTDPRVEVTFNAVNWDALLDIVCRHLRVQQAQWGEQKSGGYNLVRFLNLDDSDKTTVVVHVPLLPAEGTTRRRMQHFCSRLASEVATMQYVEEYTNIPVPHVICYGTEVDDSGFQSPYIVMSVIEGTPLRSVWDEMPDEKRDIVLRQVVDIYLELAAHRFDKIGALFKTEGEGRHTWIIKPLSLGTISGEFSPVKEVYDNTYTSGTDYWIAYMNEYLRKESEEHFGSESKSHGYAMAWFMRSLIPSLYDPTLDGTGFLLQLADLDSQNIMITNVESSPRITAVIDWEDSATTCTSSFAQYPFFIVDYPFWEEDHPLRPRNLRDQAAFDRFMLEAERKNDPSGDQPLSRAFANCHGVYLFEQCITDQRFNVLYEQLFEHIFGDDDEFRTSYYWALMEDGLLRKETKQFDYEAEVWKEAKEVLGDEVADKSFTRSEFTAFANERKDRFPVEGKVREWLDSLVKQEREF